VLFDEIKGSGCHASPAPDSGRGQNHDSLGAKIDFPEHDYHHDSNVGAELIKRQTAMALARSRPRIYEAMRDKILDESKRCLKPEFLNRWMT